jgi:hypothetical protein
MLLATTGSGYDIVLIKVTQSSLVGVSAARIAARLFSTPNGTQSCSAMNRTKSSWQPRKASSIPFNGRRSYEFGLPLAASKCGRASSAALFHMTRDACNSVT